MKVLVICDTVEGKAREISLFLKCEAERMNRRVVVLNAEEISKQPDSFNVVIVVAEISDSFSNVVSNYVMRYASTLNDCPSFFIGALSCNDESDLIVPESTRGTVRHFLHDVSWNPQQVLLLPIGTRLQGNEFVTLADWPELKMSLQRFLIKNDLMLVG